MSDAQQSPLAIEALIAGRLQDLKLTPVELVRRCGYKNLSKGLRRLEGVREGYFDGQEWLLHALPDALGVPPEKVQQAVEDTRRYLHEEKFAPLRVRFAMSRDFILDGELVALDAKPASAAKLLDGPPSCIVMPGAFVDGLELLKRSRSRHGK